MKAHAHLVPFSNVLFQIMTLKVFSRYWEGQKFFYPILRVQSPNDSKCQQLTAFGRNSNNNNCFSLPSKVSMDTFLFNPHTILVDRVSKDFMIIPIPYAISIALSGHIVNFFTDMIRKKNPAEKNMARSVYARFCVFLENLQERVACLF